MVGIVIVSHSAALARGVAELARGMAGEDVAIEAVGGMDAPERPLGTDPLGVAAAIERACSTDGAIVLMDLGSAVLSAEMALDMVSDNLRGDVVLCEAPLVEGAVSAAVQARLGSSLATVVAEARASLGPKKEQLEPSKESRPTDGFPPLPAEAEELLSIRLTVPNALGLHARPAARLAKLSAGFHGSEIFIRNLSKGKGPAKASSLNAIAMLGAARGDELELSASGPEARAALDAIRALAADNFGDSPDEARAQDPPSKTPGDREDIGIVPHPGSKLADASLGERAFRGVAASRGFALGPALRYEASTPEPPTGPGEAPDIELGRLEGALGIAQKDIEAMRDELLARGARSEAEIMDAHAAMLRDDVLLEPVRAAIRDGTSNAAAAWKAACDRVARGYEGMEDEYLRGRAVDVLDVRDRVLRALLGSKVGVPAIDSPSVIIAKELSPSETMAFDPSMVLAICTAAGGATSHAAILARGLGIPAAAGLGEGILMIPNGAELAVDGRTGLVVAGPNAETRRSFREKIAAARAEAEAALRESGAAAFTADGKRVEVFANVASLAEALAAAAAGAEGIGLLRTEFVFAGRDSAPTEEEQYAIYRDIAAAMGGRPVVIRTLDAGGDKPLPYLDLGKENNPFLGWRGIRVCLERPELFKIQLRAILRAGAEYPVKIMFPMIATRAEFATARAMVEEAKSELASKGYAVPERLEVGAMIEVPSAAVCADSIAGEADFFSIGTNDLTQYTMAAERGNSHVAALSDYRNPAVLRLIRSVTNAALAHGRWVGVCGEMGGDPELAGILLGLGVTELSAAAASVPLVKRAVRRLNTARAATLASEALALDSAVAVGALINESKGPETSG